jgi:osmotically-inducible protein OsmY
MERDIEIQTNVMEELKTIPMLKANEIGVAVKNGIVTLCGIVDSYPKKISIEKAVKKIAGVKGIAEDIDVELNGNQKKSDSELAQNIMKALEWDTTVQINNLNILVEDSCVTLEGFVEWDFQRKSATKAIENIVGVKGVINNVKLSASPTTREIKSKIQSAFIRNANIDSEKINVKIDGSKVVLTGSVNSWSEYEDAEQSVWATPGVKSIENKLEFELDF